MAQTFMRVCEQCGRTFECEEIRIKRGNGRFCGRSCVAKFYALGKSACSRFPEGVINPEGINTCNRLQNTSCPVSEQMLFQMYWKEGKSIAEITENLSLMRDDSKDRFSRNTIKYWLLKIGITLRSPSEVLAMSYRNNPLRRKAASEHAAKLRAEGKFKRHTSPNSKHMRKLLQSRLKALELRRITLVCALPGCGKEFIRTPSKYKSDRVYCSKSCAQKHRMQLKAASQEQANLKKRAELVFGELARV